VSVEKERVVQLLGGELSRNSQDAVVIGRMQLWWMQGKKIEAERIDDEEDSAFVGRR